MTPVSTTDHAAAELRAWPQASPSLWARALGRAEDLDIDFRLRRPHLVTQILARCLRDASGAPWSAEALWQWTVPQRTQGLLAVARACAVASVAAVARCTRAGCGEQLELELDIESFAREVSERDCSWNGGRYGDEPGGEAERVTLRLPTGMDQLRWLDDAPSQDADGLALQMGASLVREIGGRQPEAEWCLPRAWLAGIEDALGEIDPTTALSIDVACTGCGSELGVEIDLEALVLARLAQLQRALLLEVHSLASGYHWSESEILALPAWRRARYIGALRGEG